VTALVRFSSRRIGGALAVALLVAAARASAEQVAAESRATLLSAARAVMRASGRAALITIDGEGRAQARTMDAAPPDGEMIVWLATNPRSQKVIEIRANPAVTLYYFDPEAPGYVSVLGRARLVDAPEEKERHWQRGWDAFYASRADALLIEVVPERLEVLNLARDIEGDRETWRPPTVLFHAQPRPPTQPPTPSARPRGPITGR
jgi:general stress protein 26